MLCQSALALLVLGVLADNHDLAVALDYLALLAHGLDRRSDFHLKFLLFKGVVPEALAAGSGRTPLFGSPCNASAGEVIGAHLNRDLVARENTDEVHTELAGYMGQDYVAASDVHVEHCIGQGFDDRALKLDYIVFRQVYNLPLGWRQISSAIVRISGSPSVMRIVFS